MTDYVRDIRDINLDLQYETWRFENDYTSKSRYLRMAHELLEEILHKLEETEQ